MNSRSCKRHFYLPKIRNCILCNKPPFPYDIFWDLTEEDYQQLEEILGEDLR